MTRNEIIEKYDFNSDDLAEDEENEKEFIIEEFKTIKYVYKFEAKDLDEAKAKYFDGLEHISEKVIDVDFYIKEV